MISRHLIGPEKKLNYSIRLEEVKTSVKKLNNRRSPGKDEITAELIKYGPEILIRLIEKELNFIFEKHQFRTSIRLSDVTSRV